jgi:hypothetical protein
MAGARVHLSSPAADAREEAHAGEAGRHPGGGILAAAVDQDDLGFRDAGFQIGQQALEVFRLVQGGNDDADQEETRAVSLRLQS